MIYSDVLKENLKLWHDAAAENRELRLLAVMQAARDAAADWNAGYAQDPTAWRIPRPRLSSPAPLPTANAFASALALDEQLAFCRELLSLAPHFPRDDEEREAPMPFPIAPRLATLGGEFFTEALRGFASVIPHTVPARTNSFSAVLEEVAIGNADLALLPTEDERGGKRLSLIEECDRLELHINCVADIPSPHGGRRVQFALISRNPAPLLPASGKQMLECRVFDEDDFALADFLAAAAACGLSLSRIDSLPDSYGEGIFAHHVTLSREQGDPALLEAYMALRLPRSFVTGHYLYL